MKKKIPQDVLEQYERVRRQRKLHENNVAACRKIEDEIKKRIENSFAIGMTVEKGRLTAYHKDGARRPRWKDEFVNRLGKEEADQVIANTVPSKVLVIEVVE